MSTAYINTGIICFIFVHVIIKIIPLRADSTPGNEAYIVCSDQNHVISFL